MPLLNHKNTFASGNGNPDVQRTDLFHVSVALPAALRAHGGASIWDSEIAYAIKNFPFPDRGVDTIPIKMGQQTNYAIGADQPVDPIDISARFAFNRRTAELLERWFQLTSDRGTGRVARAGAIKSTGYFFWLVPNDAVLGIDGAAERDSYKLLRAFQLEGCWCRNMKFTGADRSEHAAAVDVQFSMVIDRYRPVSVTDLVVIQAADRVAAAFSSTTA